MEVSNSGNKSTRRIIMAVGYFLIMTILAVLISQVIAYFYTGADRSALHFTAEALSIHTPKVKWVQNEANSPGWLDEYQKSEIEKAYLESWYVANTCFRTKTEGSLSDYFAKPLAEKIMQTLEKQKDYKVSRTDLSHHIHPALFSLDKQVFAFTDHHVEVRKKITDLENDHVIYQNSEVADYDVLMTLDDGKWRVRHLIKTSSGHPESLLMGLNDPTGFFQIRNNKIYKNGQPFTVRGVNYYPARSPWLDFWPSLHEDTIRQDFKRIQDLNLNTVRIFVPYGIFGRGNVEPEMLNKLDLVVKTARHHDLALVITLFDFPEGYSYQWYPANDRYLETILKRYKEEPHILSWDIKNEADRDFSLHGQGEVLEWLEFILERAKKYAPHHLFTIGWSLSEFGHLHSDKVDIVSFHYYDDPDGLGTTIDQLGAKIGNKPVMVQEIGASNFSSMLYPGGRTVTEQALYYKRVLDTLETRGQIPFLLWTLYDFEEAPQEVFGLKPWVRYQQQHFGILTIDGKKKPAAAVVAEPESMTGLKRSIKDYLKRSPLSLVIIILLLGLGFVLGWKKWKR